MLPVAAADLSRSRQVRRPVAAAAALPLLSVPVTLALAATCSFPLVRRLPPVDALALRVAVALLVATPRLLRALVLPPLGVH
jgi:hypothetical protein